MSTSSTTFELEPADFSLSGFLAEEHARDLLRFSTAGSVDDGKSTFIGRLLYDTQSVYEDQVHSIEGKGTTGAGVLDLALLTDGLRAEREQGITIDVAYRYFSTTNRKFIIADTPGHEQYTRNMATGASTASLAIVLVDARKGVLIQSRRHACITALLGVRHILVAVNKMDLVDYDEQVFNAIRARLHSLLRPAWRSPPAAPVLRPCQRSLRRQRRPPNYRDALVCRGLRSSSCLSLFPRRKPALLIPSVLRSSESCVPTRTFAASLDRSPLARFGPATRSWFCLRAAPAASDRIVTFDGDLHEAHAPQSVTLTLTDELDISRGDLLVSPESPAVTTTRFTASLVWMDEQPLDLTRRYLLKHTSRTVQAQVIAVQHRLDVATLEQQPAATLALNGIGLVEIESVQPLTVDSYSTNRTTGSFVLIDAVNNATVAAGMIRDTTAEAFARSTIPVSADGTHRPLASCRSAPAPHRTCSPSPTQRSERSSFVEPSSSDPPPHLPRLSRPLPLPGALDPHPRSVRQPNRSYR